MSKFSITKKLSLDFLGEDWVECYLIFNTPSIVELNESISGLIDFKEDDIKSVKENFSKTMDLLKANFVEGKGVVKKEVVSLKKNDLDEFPAEVINKAMGFLVSGSAKNE